MSYIAATMDSIVGHLRPGQLVVLESTTYPGTTEELIAPAIERAGRVKVIRDTMLPDGVLVAYSPEREDPGNTSIDRRDIPKVVGGMGQLAAEAAAALYNVAFHRVIRVSSPAAAEMTKLLENIYRCVNIALGERTEAALPAHGHRHLGGDRRGCHQALRLPAFLSRPGTGWALHPDRSLLSELEGKGIRLQHPLHRAGGRSE